MALLSGFDVLSSANDTFTDWLSKTNAMIVLMRDDVLTANSTIANTVGDAQLLGYFSANIVAANTMRGGSLTGGSANLNFSSNTTFAANSTFQNNVIVYVTSDIQVAGGAFPTTNAVSMGNSTTRWDMYATDVDVSGNVDVTGHILVVGNVSAEGFTSNTIETGFITGTAGTLNVNSNTTFGDDVSVSSDLSVTANLSVTQDISGNNITSNTVATKTISAANGLTVASNTTFSSNVIANGDLKLNSTFTYTIVSNNLSNVIPPTTGLDLGNTTNRWDAFLSNTQVATGGYLHPQSNGVACGNTTKRWDMYATDISASGTLDVTGNTTFVNVKINGTGNVVSLEATNATVTANINANNITSNTVATKTISAANGLTVASNTTFNSNVVMNGGLTLGSTLTYTIVSNNISHLIPPTTGLDLGNTTNRWDAFLANTQVATGKYLHPQSNGVACGNTTKRWDMYATDIDASGALDVTGSITGANLVITGTANIATLEISSLTTDRVALIGNTANVTSNSATVIDSFPATQSYGLKYFIHATTGSEDSVYTLEILCGHSYGANTPFMHFTRYGEIAVDANITLVPDLNGANVELTATCPSAGVGNTHSFKIMRMETR